ncbi:hypothetical protein FACS1894164_05150 [Spirochaetia bacterium]|nr:hypothetical protein FACS1894164_05150 [Spirochaetia bacterium]
MDIIVLGTMYITMEDIMEQVADDNLLNKAFAISGLKMKQEMMNLALEEFIQKRKVKEFLALAGTIDFDEDWDPRKIRGKTW